MDLCYTFYTVRHLFEKKRFWDSRKKLSSRASRVYYCNYPKKITPLERECYLKMLFLRPAIVSSSHTLSEIGVCHKKKLKNIFRESQNFFKFLYVYINFAAPGIISLRINFSALSFKDSIITCVDYTIRKAILFGNLETGVRGIVTYMLRGKSFGTNLYNRWKLWWENYLPSLIKVFRNF